MNSKQLFYFVSVAETGSFTAAAQKLGLSQPPLSKQIMLLEEELGVMLLKRGSRKAELTEEGTYLYGQAKNILSMMDTTAQELSLSRRTKWGSAVWNDFFLRIHSD